MLNSKQILQEANIMPKLKLAVQTQGGGVNGTGVHRVKILEDEKRTELDRDTGKEIDVVRFIFEENHEKKYYDVPVLDKKGEVHYLIQRLGEMREGQELMLEYKRAGMKGYIHVTPVDPAEEFQIDEDESTIDLDEEQS